MSQQAAQLGFGVCAQFEFSRRLRKALHADPALRRAVAAALVSAGHAALAEPLASEPLASDDAPSRCDNAATEADGAAGSAGRRQQRGGSSLAAP